MKRQFFGTDGIRDVAGQGRLSPDQVSAYGQALGAWLSEQKPKARVLIGRDTRASGPNLLQQLSTGFLSAGHDIVDGGVLPTPAVQTLCREEDFDLSIVISASHNPAHDNGLKFFGSNGRKLPDDAEERLEELTIASLQGQITSPTVSAAGQIHRDKGAGERYLASLGSHFSGLDLSGMTVVLDCAHGAGATLAPEMLRRLNADVLVHGVKPDGMNINDGAGVFHVGEHAELVRSKSAVGAFALDGDADRVLILDDTGTERDGDHMLGFLAKDLKERGLLKGDMLVTTVMANLGLKVWCEDLGITCDMVPVGDRFVAEEMSQSGAVLGGEQSGHVIFRDGDAWFGDGLFTTLSILELMKRSGQSLSELSKGVEKYPQMLVNVPVREKLPADQVPELVAARQAAEDRLGKEGRVVLRYSGTEPLLRVMVEGKNIALVEELVQTMVDVANESLGK